ncbi:actin-domain-containing protein [Setomelanomma holmii]|uniref:Actin-like protein ARP6 n=1 Tax=Setomelanomma holmii TaxID=210430 RepID=A0A9P4H167_9PLEO|nr:actin-domain-containing protein [Setomelanomma holmii]
MPPKGSRKSAAAAPSKTLVIDNGACSIKAGLVPGTSNAPTYDDCRVIPNCIARSTRDKCTYVGSELDGCKDFGELAFRRPVEKGFIVNWEAEKAIWEHEFMGAAVEEVLKVSYSRQRQAKPAQCDPRETNLLLTEKPNCPKELQKNCDEIVFEQFEFASYYRCVGPRLNAYHPLSPASLAALPQECLLVIDTSYSDTTILPLYNGKLIQSAVRRLTVGGKLLTNYIKELASLRHYNLMEETYLMNEIKEAISYVAPSPQHFSMDLERTWKGRLGNKRERDLSVVVDYVLPDYETAIHGHARPHDPAKSRMRRGLQPLQGPREDLLPMGNERFAVPELLFNPSDIGIQEAGIPGAVMESMKGLPEALRVGMLSNVVVVGGNSLITGFIERLEDELRALVPAQYLNSCFINVQLPFGAFAMLIGQSAAGLARCAQLCQPRISTSMRRIPPPSRAIDLSAHLPLTARPRIAPSPCPSVAACCTHTRNSTAAFSTTSANAFLLPGKQDKKKHQQFVRRWQKRLLGDSEPIGAHVDPYDPTSPVRIAPEEQGDYEEVLEEDLEKRKRGGRTRSSAGSTVTETATYEYVPAEELGGPKLMHVGGEAWLDQKREVELAKEFEKLTCRTYTPLTMRMVEEIESLTGSSYSARGGSSLTPEVRDAVHEMTGRPYTNYEKIAKRGHLPTRFVQAVTEVYTLKEAGLDLDMASLPNRGVYSSYGSPPWVHDVKLRTSTSGELILTYPRYTSAEQILNIILNPPEWDPAQTVEQEELVDAESEVLVEDAADLLDPVLPQESMPTMDPATPAFKRAAVVKIDPEKKPFDFMSNRPVPRAKPAISEKVEDMLNAEAPTATPSAPSSVRIAELITAFESSRSAISGMPLRKAVRQSTYSTVGASEVRWRQVPVTDLAVKFAIFKRLHQLTGLRIPDSHLTASKTLGDIYSHLCAAAKPQPTSLYSAIHIEGQKARERAKQQGSALETSRARADLGDLLALGNVALRGSKLDKVEARTKMGMQKPSRRHVLPPAEGTRRTPEFGRPVPSKTVAKLTKRRDTLAKN